MSEHSPSPWKLTMLGGGKGSGGNDWSVRQDVPGSEQNSECAIAIVRRKPEPGIALANARLIAAAPDILDALKELVDIINDGESRSGIDSFTCQPARAAIAKAEGR